VNLKNQSLKVEESKISSTEKKLEENSSKMDLWFKRQAQILQKEAEIKRRNQEKQSYMRSLKDNRTK